ncbi:hypothetical protein DFH07DRAFT_1010441, partial [Mycena maculata]
SVHSLTRYIFPSNHNQFSAWICIDGKEPAPEYGVVTSEDNKTVHCFIASELGKKFSVHWTNLSYDGLTLGHIDMDGKDCGGKMIYSRSLPKSTYKEGVAHQMSVQPFVFSSLSLTDDDDFLGGLHDALGVIDLTICPVEITERNAIPKNRSLSQLKVHEKIKKTITQQIALADPVVGPNPDNFARSRRIGDDIVKFSFNYRPIELLEANGIVSRRSGFKRKASPKPVRAPALNVDVEEEKRALRERLNALQTKRIKKEKKPRVKSEAGEMFDVTWDGPGSLSKEVKLEVKVKAEDRKPPFFSGEVIDLT